MITYDLEIGYGSGWIAIVPTGTKVHIFNESNTGVYYRFGSSGSSNGILMNAKDSISASETVYVKDESHFKTKLTIVGD